jgi:hypothetical protein
MRHKEQIMDLLLRDRSFGVQALRLRRSTRVATIVVFAALVGVGCAKENAPPVVHGQMAAPAPAPATATLARQSSTLATAHSLVLDVSESQLDDQFGKVSDRCTTDVQHHCTIMQSDLSSGATPSGSIRLRIDPDAFEGLASLRMPCVQTICAAC